MVNNYRERSSVEPLAAISPKDQRTKKAILLTYLNSISRKITLKSSRINNHNKLYKPIIINSLLTIHKTTTINILTY